MPSIDHDMNNFKTLNTAFFDPFCGHPARTRGSPLHLPATNCLHCVPERGCIRGMSHHHGRKPESLVKSDSKDQQGFRGGPLRFHPVTPIRPSISAAPREKGARVGDRHHTPFNPSSARSPLSLSNRHQWVACRLRTLPPAPEGFVIFTNQLELRLAAVIFGTAWRATPRL
jgi:hypothetical protein